MTDPLIALSVALFVIAILVILFWPRWGIFPRWKQARSATERVLTEDALKHLYFCEMNSRQPTIQSTAGKLQISENKAVALLESMQARDLVELSGGMLRLTPAGHEYALHIIRAHRLWERYLADKTGYGETQWHDQAEQVEHELTQAEIDRLAAQLGNPTYDPHGDPIPSKDGHIETIQGAPLSQAELNRPYCLVRVLVQDSERLNYLGSLGLYPHVTVALLKRAPFDGPLLIDVEGEHHALAYDIAQQILVAPVGS